jgi:hypothetical protein
MSREPKKKPGDMMRARKRHLSRQALSDKIKAISLLDGNDTAWHTVHDPYRNTTMRVKLAKFDRETFNWPGRILVRFGNRLATVWAPDNMSLGGGSVYINDFWIAGHVPVKQILATVLDSYDRDAVFDRNSYHGD